jgi:glycosyltransferase involved in cell wall biosynthesis
MATLIVVEDLAAYATLGRGGQTMFLLQYLRGLERLGHRVLFVEFRQKEPTETRPAVLRYFHESVTTWWHPEWAALIIESPLKSLYGLDVQQVARIADEADALITLSAHYRAEPFPLIGEVRPRILVESDPGYTHLWAVEEDSPVKVFGEHDYYFTVGRNIGTPRCSVPTGGINWRHTWNPVVLEMWSAERPVTRNRFTTIADWRGFGYLEFEGAILGPKAEEFRKFIDLPSLAGETLEIAIRIDPDDPDVTYLTEHGWTLESTEVVANPGLYRDYVAGSLAEFSCAKGGYVGTHCGWFSDRSSFYLAAGRPVVVQDTGFEDLIPTGQGLFSVRKPEEAAEAIKEIRRDYGRHAAAARALAREHFDSDRILGRLLAESGIGGGRP